MNIEYSTIINVVCFVSIFTICLWLHSRVKTLERTMQSTTNFVRAKGTPKHKPSMEALHNTSIPKDDDSSV